MFHPQISWRNGQIRGILRVGRLFYSRKSSSNHSGQFKIVSKARDGDEFVRNKLSHNENWELFGRSGFRFFMPGNVGPAWHDNITSSFIPSTLKSQESMELECIVQDCPLLLRSGVEEMFPSTDTSSTPLTIVTLTAKTSKNNKTENDVEKLTKEFMWAAQEICGKLRLAGYWADFINPFSGQPFHSAPSPNDTLFKTDHRFRCLGFQVINRGHCRVISPSYSKHRFIGTLFTTAPSSTEKLKEILKIYESCDLYPEDV